MIYFPVTCNILTVGHIRCLEYLCKRDFVVVGLLTKKALHGYKQEVVPFEDRKYILQMIAVSPFIVVPQESLDPTANIKKYNCDSIASGDGWEKEELQSIKKLGLKIINIQLKGEKKKKYSSTKILNEHKRHKK